MVERKICKPRDGFVTSETNIVEWLYTPAEVSLNVVKLCKLMHDY